MGILGIYYEAGRNVVDVNAFRFSRKSLESAENLDLRIVATEVSGEADLLPGTNYEAFMGDTDFPAAVLHKGGLFEDFDFLIGINLEAADLNFLVTATSSSAARLPRLQIHERFVSFALFFSTICSTIVVLLTLSADISLENIPRSPLGATLYM